MASNMVVAMTVVVIVVVEWVLFEIGVCLDYLHFDHAFGLSHLNNHLTGTAVDTEMVFQNFVPAYCMETKESLLMDIPH